MYIEIIRTHEIKGSDGFKFQTIGKLTVYQTKKKKIKLFSCITLERPWLENKKNVSCIPPAPQQKATYTWEKLDVSPSFAYTHLWLREVPNRTYIKMHVANSYDEIHGCIAVGDELVYLEGDDVVDIVNSRATLKELMKLLPDTGEITIISQVETSNRVPSIDVVDRIQPAELPDLSDDLSGIEPDFASYLQPL